MAEKSDKIEIIHHGRERIVFSATTPTGRKTFKLGSYEDREHEDPALRNRRTVSGEELKFLRAGKVFREMEASGQISVYGA